MHRKSLEINEKLGRIEGMAVAYGNLGFIMKTRGDANAAQENWSKSRDLYERLGDDTTRNVCKVGSTVCRAEMR